MSLAGKIAQMNADNAVRVQACVAFCEGAPMEALLPGGLMRSFRALTPGGDAFETLTLAVEHERLKAENVRLQVELNSFYRTQPELIQRVQELEGQIKLLEKQAHDNAGW